MQNSYIQPKDSVRGKAVDVMANIAAANRALANGLNVAIAKILNELVYSQSAVLARNEVDKNFDEIMLVLQKFRVTMTFSETSLLRSAQSSLRGPKGPAINFWGAVQDRVVAIIGSKHGQESHEETGSKLLFGRISFTHRQDEIA